MGYNDALVHVQLILVKIELKETLYCNVSFSFGCSNHCLQHQPFQLWCCTQVSDLQQPDWPKHFNSDQVELMAATAG